MSKSKCSCKPNCKVSVTYPIDQVTDLVYSGKSRSFALKDDCETTVSVICFYCFEMYNSDQIEWESTCNALCPYCGIDSVIVQSASPMFIQREFLRDLHHYAFSQIAPKLFHLK